MQQLLFADDRPCSACRPCSLNYALFKRRDVLPILLRIENEPVDEDYRRLTQHLPQFYLDPRAPVTAEVQRFRDWATVADLSPTQFCCMSEPLQELWQAFARELRLPALSGPTAHALRHKPTMKEWIRASGLKTADYAPVSDFADIDAFARCHGYPVVVKPVNGWGALDTMVLRCASDVPRIGEALARHTTMMVEAFVPMREYECCALICDMEVLDVYPSIMPAAPIEAAQGAINANISLGPCRDKIPVADLRGTVQTLVSGFGLDHGYLHMELFADGTQKEPLISEVALRYPGCEIAKNHGLALGFDIANATIDIYLGLKPHLDYGRQRCVGDLLLPYRAGRVTRISSEVELMGLPGVIEVHLDIRPGDLLARLPNASFNCSGWLFVEGVSPEQVEQRMHQVLREFILDVDDPENSR